METYDFLCDRACVWGVRGDARPREQGAREQEAVRRRCVARVCMQGMRGVLSYNVKTHTAAAPHDSDVYTSRVPALVQMPGPFSKQHSTRDSKRCTRAGVTTARRRMRPARPTRRPPAARANGGPCRTPWRALGSPLASPSSGSARPSSGLATRRASSMGLVRRARPCRMRVMGRGSVGQILAAPFASWGLPRLAAIGRCCR